MQNSAFRPIYYLGCKTNFTSAIRAAIDDVDPSGGRLVDLFAGTGAVGAALASTREVTTVDVQEYSRVLCSAVLNPPQITDSDINELISQISNSEVLRELDSCLKPLIEYEHTCINTAIHGDSAALVEMLESPPLAVLPYGEVRQSSSPLSDTTSKAIDNLVTSKLWKSSDSMMTRQFGGTYFSFRQAAVLDAILTAAAKASDTTRDTLLAAALSTASQIVNTVGKQFAQPIRPRNKAGKVKGGLVKVVRRDRLIDVLSSYSGWLARYAQVPAARGTPRAIRQDYLVALADKESSLSVVYADPPYTRDHYSRFYHVLETMCLRDDPQISLVRKRGLLTASRGAYREDRHQSPFCIRSTAPGAFDALFKAARARDLPMVLSYSPHERGDGTHPRVVSMKQITEIARSSYDRVEVCIIEGSTHNKLNSGELELKTRDHAEVLLKCFC